MLFLCQKTYSWSQCQLNHSEVLLEFEPAVVVLGFRGNVGFFPYRFCCCCFVGFTLAQTILTTQASDFFPVFQVAQVPLFSPKGRGNRLGSNPGPFATHLHALLTVPLPLGNQYF